MRPEIWPANIILPMLRIPEKKTTIVNLCPALYADIAEEYSEQVAQDLARDILRLNNLRIRLQDLAEETSFNTRWWILSSYFRGLCLVETLFFSAKGQINNLTFTWHDAFNKNKKASQRNIHFDKAGVLFNVGAVCSQIGQSNDRRTNKKREEAVHEFCRAARAFAYLRDNVADEAAMGWSTTVDVSVECTGMLDKLMLAQAQECQFEIAIAQGKTREACAQVSLQVALYYEEALAAQNAEPLKGHIVQDWKTYMQLKAALFNAVACYGHALKLREENGVAEGIARLESGISTLSEAKKPFLLLFASIEIKMIVEAIKELEAMMKRSLKTAKEEIGSRRRVPPPDSLPSLPPCSMIKQPPIEEVLVARNKNLLAGFDRNIGDMFAGFVRHSSAKALSRYAELVAGIIQTHDIKLHQCCARGNTKLKEMDLPDFIQALEGQVTLPANLEQGLKEVHLRGGRAGLETALLQLGKQRQETLELVVQIKEHVQTRPQSSTQSKNLQDQFNMITDKLKQAAETYAKIECSMKYHSALMPFLDRQTIKSAFPDISLDADEDYIVKALKNSLGKLKTLEAEGKWLQQDLKHMHEKDDIRPKLSAPTSSQEDLFKKEILKYDRTCKEIDQNIEAREQLLSQIQAQNDRLSPFSKVEKSKASRQKLYEEIRAAIAPYREIMENINQAENFYIDFQKTVTNVKRQCGEFQGPQMIGLESEVHGQAASDLIAGSDSKAAILAILEMGGGTWDRGTVVRALRAAHNNPYRAVEYLCSGIPEQAEVPQAANPPAQRAQPTQPATGQLPSAMPQAVTFMPEEREAMERLEDVGLGFDRESVRKVFLACNKNGELAANYLLDHKHEYED